ncbi:hypothetical protein ACIRRA_42820 [Nocardia sp. NPDC101769]|uniref:hypothetical protein n=1 Tax=Nocardia sp. NPDC101769 TaxID=3364333 RepID=UPI003807E374
MDLHICPGPLMTRKPGRIYGASDREPYTMEWQWAQGVTYGYYYMDFRREYYPYAMVLSEAMFSTILSDSLTNELFGMLTADFRGSGGGLLRPDILGLAKSTEGFDIILELLEVSTIGQATSTLKGDVIRKLDKFSTIIQRLAPEISREFSLTSYAVAARASSWKPRQAFQRVAPLPLRQDSSGGRWVEWICFEPTFRINPPDGLPGVILYEIHSVPIDSELWKRIPELFQKIAETEERNRRMGKISYGQTLTPWTTAMDIERNPYDRENLLVVTGVLGIGLVIIASIYLWPVVAGEEFAYTVAGALLASGKEVADSAIAGFSAGVASTVTTGMTLSSTLGHPIVTKGVGVY